jgi:hypothetical protein
MMIRRHALLAVLTAGSLISGCGYGYRSRYYYGPRAVRVRTYDPAYGYSAAYAPGTTYYAGGYYGGAYYRAGYYPANAPFVTVQAAPAAYVQQPAYVQPAYVQPAYAQPVYSQPGYAQPVYAQPPTVYAQPPAQPTYVRPSSSVYVAPARPVQVGPATAVPVAPVNGSVRVQVR